MAAGIDFLDSLRFSFSEEEIEAEFRSDALGASVRIVRAGVVLALALYGLFGILDVYMLPENHATVWVIRFGVVIPFLLAVLVASWHPRFEVVQEPIVVLTAMVLGFGILAMMYVADPAEPGYASYYTGLLLVVIWIGTFSQLRFWPSFYSVLSVLAGYVLVTLVVRGIVATRPDGGGIPQFINNSFFLAGAAILAVFSSFAFERSKRHRFLQTRVIAEEKAKTQVLLDKVETLFGQQVSEEVVRELVKDGGQTESRLCRVTVMFLDIRDFTAFADSKAPEEVASFQNAVFSELIDIVRGHRGIINQILGDGIMATFGAPVATETHVDDAVSAGYRILERVEELSEEGRIPPIRLGIGLHTGQVLAGNIGNDFRKQYSLTGSTVNVAARIEQLNKQHESRFLVSGSVYERLDPERHAAEHLGELSLRGVSEPLPLYRLA
jgi:class 3 adenylate cyclase